MAKDNSFDIVSHVDIQEVDNAVNQAAKELHQRYDLKDSGAHLELDKAGHAITVTGPSDFVCRQVIDVLGTKLVRRDVDLKALDWADPETVGGGNVKIAGRIVMGIDQDLARKINKDIRDEKFKAKVQIEGDKLRVTSPKRDELQEIIRFVKEKDYGIPLQYVNYR